NINFGIGDKNSSKCRNRVSSKSRLISLRQSFSLGEATSVIVFQNGKGGIFYYKFTHKISGSIKIQKIVVRKFFTVKLVEDFIKITIKPAFLMWIFSISKRFLFLQICYFAESFRFITGKIVENCSVIIRGYFKSFCCEFFSIFQRYFS